MQEHIVEVACSKAQTAAGTGALPMLA